MNVILFVSFLFVAIIGFLAGMYIPSAILVPFAWINFLVIIVLVAAWNKADKERTVPIIITAIVFWLCTVAGYQLK